MKFILDAFQISVTFILMILDMVWKFPFFLLGALYASAADTFLAGKQHYVKWLHKVHGPE